MSMSFEFYGATSRVVRVNHNRPCEASVMLSRHVFGDSRVLVSTAHDVLVLVKWSTFQSSLGSTIILKPWRFRPLHLFFSRRLVAGASELLACSFLLFLGGVSDSEEVKTPAFSS